MPQGLIDRKTHTDLLLESIGRYEPEHYEDCESVDGLGGCQ